MNTEMIKLYKQLNDMEPTKEVAQIKNQIKESLFQELRMSFLDVLEIGEVIGYDRLQEQMENAIALIKTMEAK